MNHMCPNRTSDPEALVQCPYDKTHMIRVLAWPRHIIKCRRNHPTVDMKVCPFNARHEVPRHAMVHHIATCPDQTIIHQELIAQANKLNGGSTQVKGNTDVPPYNSTVDFVSAEDWDEECRRQPVRVDPTVNSQTVIPLDRGGLTPAQRREHRRLLKLLNDKNKAGENTDDIRAQINALARGGSNFAGIGAPGAPGVEAQRPALPRMPHGPPQVDKQVPQHHQMNGVRTQNGETNAAEADRVAARFNGIGIGRGGRAQWSDPELDRKYEILAKLAAGRGGPKKVQQ